MVNLMHDLYSMMEEEIDGAETYAAKALSYKASMPDLAKMFYQMSGDEMKHASMIEAEIKKTVAVEKAKDTQLNLPHDRTMESIYTFMHDQFAARVVKVRVMQEKFKEA